MFTRSVREQFIIDRTLYKYFYIIAITWATAGVKEGTLSLTHAPTRVCNCAYAHLHTRGLFFITYSHVFTHLFYTYFVGEALYFFLILFDIKITSSCCVD